MGDWALLDYFRDLAAPGASVQVVGEQEPPGRARGRETQPS
jgi:hypothetical protein